ncbi:MAG: hypothetical protein JXO72_15055 [Vicinamibacteria bacterium]|nr:hypothetical protein [Vicinamibacteria bacterium]
MADGHGLATSIIVYCLFVVLTIVGPGTALLRLLRLKIDPALVLPIGLCCCAVIYWLSLVLSSPWLFPAASIALDTTLVWTLRGTRRAPGPSVRGALPVFIAMAALFALTQYSVNRCGSKGEFLLDTTERHDTAFHVALTWELSHSHPPQVPGLAGTPLRYHYGAHLVRAAALRWAGIHPYDALARFDLTLWAGALMIAMRGAIHAMGGSSRIVALAPWTLFATDFSFLFAGIERARLWADMLGATFLSCLFFANAAVPALMLSLGCLIAVERHLAGEGRGWLAVACLLGAATPVFKVFMSLQLLAGFVVAFLALRRARLSLGAVGLTCALSTAALVLWSGGDRTEIALDLVAPIRAVYDYLELSPSGDLSLFFWMPAWLIASLGLRVLGLRAAASAAASQRSCAVILGVIALSAWPLRLTRITADGRFNESSYFTVQGGVILWIFTLIALSRLASRLRSPWTVSLLCVAISLPSTVEFVTRKALTPLVREAADIVLAMTLLDRLSEPGDVVLTPTYSRYPPPPIVLIGRRIAFSEFLPYRRQFSSDSDLEARSRQVRRFFKTEDVREAAGIADALDASHVFLYGKQSFRFAPETLLDPVHEGREARLYRIVRSNAQ